MKPDLLILGSIIHEKVVTPFVKKGRVSIGGSAAYAALSASRFAKVGIVSAIGSDFIDQELLFLKKQNINISSITKLNGHTLIWEVEYNHKGSIVKQKVDLGIYKDYKPKISALGRKARVLFIESTNPKFGLAALKQFDKNVLTAMDTRDYYINNRFQDLKKLLRQVDVLFLNEGELALIIRKLNLKNFSTRQLLKKYTNLQVLFLKRGAAGLSIFTRDKVAHLGALPVKKIVDPTGAGDVLAGAILGEMASHKKINLEINSLIELAKIGMVIASFVIEKRSFLGLSKANPAAIRKRLKFLNKSKVPSILDKIIIQKQKELEEIKKIVPLAAIKKNLKEQKWLGRDFKKALLEDSGMSLIAEIKKSSPSAGVISKNFNLKRIVNIYAKAKINAVSVVTDKKFFQGDLRYLMLARKTIKVPILRKDFIIDPYQLYQSKLYGADAILLIAAILDNRTIDSFIEISRKLKMDCLVEIHTFEELKRIQKTKAEIIGINNRNLDTFKVDIKTSLELAPQILPSKIIVSESGIQSRQDVKKLKQVGIKAILVGTALMGSKNILKTINQLTL